MCSWCVSVPIVRVFRSEPWPTLRLTQNVGAQSMILQMTMHANELVRADRCTVAGAENGIQVNTGPEEFGRERFGLFVHTTPSRFLRDCTTLGLFVRKTSVFFRQLRDQVILKLPEFLRPRID